MSEHDTDNKSLPSRIGNGMVIMAWIILLGMLTLFFGRFLRQQHNPNEDVVSYSNVDYEEIVLHRNRAGHYIASGKINGKPVEFLLDTGASMVSIPARLEAKLNLQRGPVMEVTTANGTIPVYATRLESIQLGNIVLTDIRASINPYMDSDEILLGMSFLKDMEFIQQGEKLTIRRYY